ncbi:polymorphic toxin-type HINT domain-containing protein [Paenibacillus sp. NRS-1782]|uniref:polymorphic toxin-type HINT domain-containing protein n=1 Tax=unclassified Paenibacillus TaxID=185978 RepID=UPI003D288E67
MIISKCNCFTAGTKVQTDEGEKPIEDIEVGERVLSKDEATGEVAYKEVTATFNHETDEIYNIHVGGQTIESTFNHPFYVKDKGWTFVKDLKPGDLLVQSDGNTLKVDSIELEQKQVRVYNMTVDEFHTYFVSDLNIWVHNTNCNLASPKRTNHILNGDKSGGGHMWPGASGKSVFPKSWHADKIMNNVSDIVTDPSLNWAKGRVVNGVQRYEVIGVRSGVKVKVITDGKDIITAYPIK